jgi:hypothetical protein
MLGVRDPLASTPVRLIKICAELGTTPLSILALWLPCASHRFAKDCTNFDSALCSKLCWKTLVKKPSLYVSDGFFNAKKYSSREIYFPLGFNDF